MATATTKKPRKPRMPPSKPVKLVRLSVEPSGECVAGCGKPAYPYTDDALLPEGYVDACREHAERAILDAYYARDVKAASRIPPCAAAMGCLCAGHARGDAATAPCNTDERASRDC